MVTKEPPSSALKGKLSKDKNADLEVEFFIGPLTRMKYPNIICSKPVLIMTDAKIEVKAKRSTCVEDNQRIIFQFFDVSVSKGNRRNSVRFKFESEVNTPGYCKNKLKCESTNLYEVETNEQQWGAIFGDLLIKDAFKKVDDVLAAVSNVKVRSRISLHEVNIFLVSLIYIIN